MSNLAIELPEGFVPLHTQVAGHQFEADNSNSIGLLQHVNSDCVLKPLGKPICGTREVAFYKSLNDDDTHNPLLAQVRQLVPKFHGLEKLDINGREMMFLKLENITHKMLKPCIMDIKVGRRTYDPLASAEKRLQEQHKYAQTKNVLGLCLPGFQMYSLQAAGRMQRFGKEYGKNLNANEFRNAIAMFLNASAQQVCRPLVQKVLQQLHSIRNWFKVQRLFHFYASSILLAYDFAQLQQYYVGDSNFLNGTKSHLIEHCSEAPELHVRVVMIDFAHVFPAHDAQPDTNYLFGLECLIGILEDLLLKDK